MLRSIRTDSLLTAQFGLPDTSSQPSNWHTVHPDSHKRADCFRAHTCTPSLQQLVQVSCDLPPATGKLQAGLPCALQRRSWSPGSPRGIVEEP